MKEVVKTHVGSYAVVIKENKIALIKKARGGYKGDKKEVVVVACNDKDMYQIEKAIKKVDPAAFMIITESHEVHGEGFKVTKIASEED